MEIFLSVNGVIASVKPKSTFLVKLKHTHTYTLALTVITPHMSKYTRVSMQADKKNVTSSVEMCLKNEVTHTYIQIYKHTYTDETYAHVHANVHMLQAAYSLPHN